MAVVEPGCGGSLVHASVEKVGCCTAGSQITPDHIPWCKQFISCEKRHFSLGHLQAEASWIQAYFLQSHRIDN